MKGILLVPLRPWIGPLDYSFPWLIAAALRKAKDDKLMAALHNVRRKRLLNQLRSRAELN